MYKLTRTILRVLLVLRMEVMDGVSHDVLWIHGFLRKQTYIIFFSLHPINSVSLYIYTHTFTCVHSSVSVRFQQLRKSSLAEKIYLRRINELRVCLAAERKGSVTPLASSREIQWRNELHVCGI